MEWVYSVINFIPTAILAVFIYLLKKEHSRLETRDNELNDDLKSLEGRFVAFKLEAGDKYAHNDDLTKLKQETNDLLNKIEGKLDRLMDMTINNAVNIAKKGE